MSLHPRQGLEVAERAGLSIGKAEAVLMGRL
jgi:hypothetical protein